MRRRLVLLSLATTSLVVVSFVVPLGLLVRDQAADRARIAAETDARSVSALVALAVGVGDTRSDIAAAVGDLPPGTIVVLDDGSIVGQRREGQGSLAGIAAETSATVAESVPGGWEIALPVLAPSGVAVVDSHVSNDELSQGVFEAWLLLGALGLALIGIAVWVADRMGRSLVRPIEELAVSAHRLAEGDLDARVEPREPEEIRDVGKAFNYLAGRLEDLLAAEREDAADLSHRLRTPLTSLRLQAETLRDPAEREATIEQLDRLTRTVDELIELARSPASRDPATCDLAEVVARRLSFWSVLAEERGRPLRVSIDETGPVARGEADIESVVDVLIENVFAHTPEGTGFSVATGGRGADPWLEVSDDGPGFGHPQWTERGASGSGSTGLGLDIARKTAGSLDAYDRPEGGAVVRLVFSSV